MPFTADDVRHAARDLGFSDAGIIPATPSPHLDAYFEWIRTGRHGTMDYLARQDRIERRADLTVILPGVRSLIIVALDYAPHPLYAQHLNDPRRGRISNYAWGHDYHDVMTPRLEQLAEWLRAEAGGEVETRVYVDTGAILERSHAQQAGLGFIGKNTMLIHPRRGSYLFLGEILTTLAFDDYDRPHRASMCGTCLRCMAACPTDAFPEPYVLDARRCISYLSIEHKGSIPEHLRGMMGNWVYGCDVCQDVCPFTRKFARPTGEEAFWPAFNERIAPRLVNLLWLTEDQFRVRYGQSAISRIGRERLVRNACVAAGNSRDPDFAHILDHLARHDASALVREHAAWGLGRL